jgi:hypothetical protein
VDKAIGQFIEGILAFGPAGLIILGLLIAIGFLGLVIRKLYQEMRIDSAAIIKIASENTAALNLLSDSIKTTDRRREELHAATVQNGVDIRAICTADEQRADLWKERFEQLMRAIERRGD